MERRSVTGILVGKAEPPLLSADVRLSSQSWDDLMRNEPWAFPGEPVGASERVRDTRPSPFTPLILKTLKLSLCLSLSRPPNP